ncbi:hypothetical protein [Xylophilus sp. ASV27]|uniref:hypothetical protein n=1 Tax=Xylophilus sp. ASV27 TaxID=2795129 RepID=UPI0018EAA71A|nr:hypothetical protein [Xylophilus sp. ASV27]
MATVLLRQAGWKDGRVRLASGAENPQKNILRGCCANMATKAAALRTLYCNDLGTFLLIATAPKTKAAGPRGPAAWG